jgi:hypothetical protein
MPNDLFTSIDLEKKKSMLITNNRDYFFLNQRMQDLDQNNSIIKPNVPKQ